MKVSFNLKSTKLTLFIAFLALLTGCGNDDSTNENEEEATEIDTSEYILVVDQGGQGVDLIDYDGNELFGWDFELALGNDANLLDDGSLVVALKADDSQITFGGYGGIIRKINADQSLDWEITYSTDAYNAHHDVEYLSNGNIIFPVWEEVVSSDAIEMGFSGSGDIYPEAIVEMNPLTEEIVWEWHVTDHLIQDHDETKRNYGAVEDNPNKIDINYNNSQENGDLMHFNGLTLDETNDILYITVNNYSEVWVVDHSTTTAEASTSANGNYNLGGDLIYRFGNPDAYDNVGNSTLNNVHYPNLLDSGNMLVFANGVYDNQSEIVEFELNPPYELVAGQDNEPNTVWTFTDPELYSSGLGSAVRMSNGNTLIAEGRDGTIWEVTNSGEVVWQYSNYETIWRAYAVSTDDAALVALGL
ncbi:MAG: arylsulfotransferase family protein [Flavobacteriaceae bacterium]